MKKLLLLPIAALLAGCNSTPKVLTNPVLQDRPKFAVSDPMPANQSPLNWVVLTKDNASEKIAELEKKQGVVSVFALTPQGYQNLSINVAELRRYIQQQNATIAAIKEYYETPVNNGEQKNVK
jgi:hypothetical protein